MTIPS